MKNSGILGSSRSRKSAEVLMNKANKVVRLAGHAWPFAWPLAYLCGFFLVAMRGIYQKIE